MKYPKFRVVETANGFVTEYMVYGTIRNTWEPFIKWSGLETAYPFSSRINAENALLMEIKKSHINHF